MTDPWTESTPEPTPHCPWCSAELKGDPVNCPSCGAALREEVAAEIPGVTQLDPAASVTARPDARGRGVLGWLSGEYEPGEGPTERAGIEPPSDAVRAEMARLEMEAIQAEIEATAATEAAERADLAAARDAAAQAEAALAAQDGEPAPPPVEPGPAS